MRQKNMRQKNYETEKYRTATAPYYFSVSYFSVSLSFCLLIFLSHIFVVWSVSVAERMIEAGLTPLSSPLLSHTSDSKRKEWESGVKPAALQRRRRFMRRFRLMLHLSVPLP